MQLFVPNRKVLFVDDEVSILDAFTSLLRKENVKVYTLSDSKQIKSYCKEHGPFAAVLSDQRMPEVDGIQVLEHVSNVSPNTVRVMVTGYSDPKETIRAINTGGISYFIAKPWDDDELKSRVQDWIARYNLKMENGYLIEELKKQNRLLTEVLDGTVSQTSRILSDMVGYVNSHGATQVDRIRKLGSAILKRISELSPTEQWEILRAFDLFNLGLSVLPAWIQVTLNKDGLGAVNRFPIARNHHLLAAELLKEIPRFEGVSRIIRLQQKCYDGTGIPNDEVCSGKEIPFGSRLLHILIDLDRQSTDNFRGRDVLQTMAKRPSKYDVDLINRILGGDAAHRSGSKETSVSVDDLQPGMVVLQEVVTNGGELLLRAPTTLTRTSINILLQWHSKDPIIELVKVRMDS